jgi:hypothetical protein
MKLAVQRFDRSPHLRIFRIKFREPLGIGQRLGGLPVLIAKTYQGGE